MPLIALPAVVATAEDRVVAGRVGDVVVHDQVVERRISDDRIVDLATRRAAAEAAVRAVAEAPVRHLPSALLDALQGSWGTAEELLTVRVAPVRLAVAR